MSDLDPVLAHQGGWDEIVFVLAPLVLFAILLLTARKRADRVDTDDGREDTSPAPETDQRP